jgi:hypothetical protein
MSANRVDLGHIITLGLYRPTDWWSSWATFECDACGAISRIDTDSDEGDEPFCNRCGERMYIQMESPNEPLQPLY